MFFFSLALAVQLFACSEFLLFVNIFLTLRNFRNFASFLAMSHRYRSFWFDLFFTAICVGMQQQFSYAHHTK